jgi:hypothetical protein
MPSRFMSAVVATITTLLITALPILGSVSAASAVPGDPIIPTSPSCVVQLVSGDPVTAPPAPTCYDPSGSDLDELLVPVYTDGYGWPVSYVDSGMGPLNNAGPNSTYGASQVSVQSKEYDPASGMYVVRHGWMLTFNTSVTAAPTPDSYWVTLGECKTAAGFTTRLATAFMRNEAGADSRYIGYVLPEADGENGTSVFDTQPAYRVLDGATIGMPLVADSPYKLGLDPGMTYTVKYWLEDRNSLATSSGAGSRLGGQVSVYVPKCGGDVTPPADTVKPSAKIIVLKRGPVFRTVKVVLGSRQATAPTSYKVIRDPRRGPTLRKTYVTKYKTVTYYKVRKGTVIKVRFNTTLLRRIV